MDIEGNALRICVTSADQLDVQPMDTDAPRILPDPKKLPPPKAVTDTCPNCGHERTRKAGVPHKTKGFMQPAYWKCSGRCPPVSVELPCKHCQKPMNMVNKGRADYYYHYPTCQHYEAGEAYWLKSSVSV